MMELTEQRLTAVRRQQGLASLPTFIDGRSPLKIPARTKCTVLLDQGFLTTAYPELKVSGGKGSKIKLTYSEALFDERGKGNRNEIDGRECRGFADEFLPDGADGRLFRPLWFKTYRYIQLDIETGAAPLVVEDLYGIYTGYPFDVRGSFESDDPALEKIWETGWRTARLCAHETYFDCPYYEQLQYAGDTRIQALISLYVSGDDRLVRKAIRMYDLSRSYEGITCSRYPSHIPQYIPPFSLYWIGMIHDYWMHRSDDAFVRSFLPGIRTVLSWFTEKIDPRTGLLKNGLPHWNFTDWATSWERGIAPESDSSGSAITTLQLAAALDDAADLMRRYDRPAEAKEYAAISAGLKKNVYEKCWDASKELLRDYIGSPTYSQHVNIMGILTAVGAGPLGLTHDEFMAIPILFGVFTPVTLGFLFMAVVGTKQMTYFSRLRRLLRAANDWTCDLPSLARKAQIKQETAYDTVTRAVGSGDLPNAAISDDYSTLYLDDSLMPTAAKPTAAPQAEPAEPLTDAEQFRREGMDFLNYLKVCRGKLGTDADEELAAMKKTCASIMGFVHNHPEQLNRVRRFREYYLPTTRKLLDTAQGLGDTDSANAAEIRRDITGILHTLNQAYEKLYDTLLQDVSMDVSTEIDTLEAMLRQDGLTHDFEADFNTRS